MCPSYTYIGPRFLKVMKRPVYCFVWINVIETLLAAKVLTSVCRYVLFNPLRFLAVTSQK
jgi:hypothetical protein